MHVYQQERKLGVCLNTVCYCWTYPKEALGVLCVPAVVFTNSPQQNLPIGCPGLAKLPNSISFLWESDGLASWYSDRQNERQNNSRWQREGDADQWRAKKSCVRRTKQCGWWKKSLTPEYDLTSQHGDAQRRQDSPLSTASTSLSMASRIIRGQMKNWAHLRRRRDKEAIIRGHMPARQRGHRSDRDNQM